MEYLYSSVIPAQAGIPRHQVLRASRANLSLAERAVASFITRRQTP